jgi:hypothetical protein
LATPSIANPLQTVLDNNKIGTSHDMAGHIQYHTVQ